MRIVTAHGADESIEEPKGPARGRRRTDVQQIAAVLRKAGYEVLGVAVDGKPECLRALAPDPGRSGLQPGRVVRR